MSEGKLAHCQLDALKQTAPVALSHQKMQLEEVMTGNCDTTLVKLSGPVGSIAVMDGAMEQAQEGRSMLLDSASPQIVKNLENAKMHLSELKVKIEDCSFSHLRTLHEDIERSFTGTAAVVQQTHEQVGALKCKKLRTEAAVRKEIF